jgi:hypothetical protein
MVTDETALYVYSFLSNYAPNLHSFSPVSPVWYSPADLKQAAVLPRLKKPSLDANDFVLYRPVSNLLFISEVIERCVARRFTSRISSHMLLPPG